MVRCGNCRHYKDRYALFLHGGYPRLMRLLELNLIDVEDFICEGWGCVFHPTHDFAHDEYGNPILEDDFPDIECEHFEPRNNRQELAKNVRSITRYHHPIEHLDVSKVNED